MKTLFTSLAAMLVTLTVACSGYADEGTTNRPLVVGNPYDNQLAYFSPRLGARFAIQTVQNAISHTLHQTPSVGPHNHHSHWILFASHSLAIHSRPGQGNTFKVMFSFLRPVSVFTKVAKTPRNDRQNLLNVNHAAARFSCHSCQRGECRLAVYQRTYDRSHSNANSQPPITAAVTWNGCHVCVLRAIIQSLPKNNSARR